MIHSSHFAIGAGTHLLWFVVHGSKSLLNSLLTHLTVVPATCEQSLERETEKSLVSKSMFFFAKCVRTKLYEAVLVLVLR